MVVREIKKAEGISWIVVGVIVCVLGWEFDLGSFHEPGGGFIAFLSGILVLGVGIVMLLSRVLSRNRPQETSEGPLTFRMLTYPRLLYTVALLLAYTILIGPLGFILSTFFLLWGISFDKKKKNWVASCLFSIITVAVSYLVFEVWLVCQLPRGIFPWW